MLGFAIYTSSTKEFKRKFSLSYGIKIFTYYILKPEVKKYFNIDSIEETPTHSFPFGEKTETGAQQIFEANKTMELNYYDAAYPDKTGIMEFSYIENNREWRDVEAFKKMVADKNGNIYPLWEFVNFIRRAFWFWIFFRDVKNSNQWFTALDACSELTALDIIVHNLRNTNAELIKTNFNVIAPADLLNAAFVGMANGEIIYHKKY